MNVKITFTKKVKLKEPYLLCGLPGIGQVGKVTIDYLITELKAILFGEIYSHFFPSYVLINQNGIVELMKNELYFWKNNGSYFGVRRIFYQHRHRFPVKQFDYARPPLLLNQQPSQNRNQIGIFAINHTQNAPIVCYNLCTAFCFI